MRVNLSSKLAILAVCGAVTVSATGCAGSGSWGAPMNMFAWGKGDAAELPEPPSVGSRPTATATAANTSEPQISIPDTPTGPPGGGPGGEVPGAPAGGYASTDPSTYAPNMPGDYGPGDTGPIGGRAGVAAQAGAYASTRPDAPAGAYGGAGYTADARNAAGGGNGGYNPGGATGGYPAGQGYPSPDAYQPGNNAPAGNGGFQPNAGGYPQTPAAQGGYPSAQGGYPSGQGGYQGGYSAPQGGYSYPPASGDYSNNSTRNPNSPASQQLLGKAGAATGPGANYGNTTAIGDSPATGGAPPASLLQAAGGFRPGSTNVAGVGQVAPAGHNGQTQPGEDVRQASYDNAPASGGQFQPQGGSFTGRNF